MTTVIHGIRNCDTMKRAMQWLEDHGIDAEFRDYKKAPPEADELRHWCDQAGWETVLNRAGLTFRRLDDADKSNLGRDKAISLMLARPSMIKRPVLEHDGQVLVGFKPELYRNHFGLDD